MNARQTLRFWIVFAILLGYYVAFEREALEPVEPEVRREKILAMFPDEATAVSVMRRGKEVRAERHDKRWKVVDPAGVVVPSDLISALLSTLAEKQEAEVLVASPSPEDLAAFGLDDPTSQIRVERKEGPPLMLSLGGRNPTRTAVYAQADQSPRIVLAGLNVDYYGELLYEAAFPDEPVPDAEAADSDDEDSGATTSSPAEEIPADAGSESEIQDDKAEDPEST